MKHTNKIIRKPTILIVVSILLVVLYLLADRYLIKHVVVDNVNVVSAAMAEKQSIQNDAGAIESVQADQTVVIPTVEPVSDDWTYYNGRVSISVQEYTSGSGNDLMTYFVADVQIVDATQLASAFADDAFGTNIIEYTSTIAAANNAIFAINGDYYGFREDGIEIRNGVIYRDVPVRIGLAFYRDGSMKVYDETQTNAQALLAEGVWNTLSFGPALLENSGVITNLANTEIDKNFGNHSIQGNNPRTGVGIIDVNHFVFVVVDGRSRGYSRGANLVEFAEIFKSLGCSEAYNLDGGGSSTMYFNGRVVNNPLGKNRERGTSDILYVSP
jgi:exopolysaccharide biosynthesis protein